MNNQKNKKFLSIYLIMMLLIGLFSGAGLQPTFAGSPEGDFGFDSSTGTITSYSGAGGDVEVPSTIGGVTVTALGDYSFQNKTTITSLVIPASVKKIGNFAFLNCSNLKTITLNEGLETLSTYAFSSTGIEAIILPNSLVSMGSDIFRDCSALKSVTLPLHLTALPNQTFLDCSLLETIELPESITSIGTYVFGNCFALKNIKLPSTLEFIDASAFSNCTALTEITLPAALKTISGYAFDKTSSLKSIYFEGNYPTVEIGYFSGLASGVHFHYKHDNTGFSIGNSQYVPLYNLTTETTSGSSISVAPNLNPNIDQKWFTEGTNIQLIMLPEAGKQFKRGSLHYMDGTTSIPIDSTFVMPNKDLHIIGEFMPIETTSYDVTINSPTGGSITSNLSNAYPGEIINLVITPESGKNLVYESLKYTLNGIEQLITGTRFVMPNGPVTISASFESSDFNFDVSTGTLTGYVGAGGAVVIPSSISGIPVVAIGDEAFKNISSITSVTIPNSVKSIGYASFNGCSAMTEITIPEGVTTMGNNVFTSCYALQSVVFPESLTTLGAGTFFYDSGLKSFNWPASLTTIPGSTFSYCSNLKNITIPEGVTEIGQSAFYHTGFESITFPASLTTLNDYVVGDISTLKSIMFKGNAPTATTFSFDNANSGLTLYHLDTASGFTNPWLGIDTVAYNPTTTYTLTYDLNGSIGTLPATITSLHLGDTLAVSAQGDLTKGTDTFKGWNTMPDGTGDSYAAGSIVTMDNKNMTLYATWLTNYAIAIATTEHGKIETLHDKALKDTTVYVVITPENGYRLKSGSLKYNDGIKDYIITESKVPPKPLKTLAKVEIPASGYAFRMPAANVTISAEFEDENILFDFDESTGTITKYLGSESNVIVPSKINGVIVKTIGERAFVQRNIKTVTLSEGITKIDNFAFAGCLNLKGLTLPESLTEIGNGGFVDSWSLSAIKFPSAVVKINSEAFAGAQELKIARFEGNAPAEFASDVFSNANPDFKIIYDSNKNGFDTNGFENYNCYTEQSFNGDDAVASDLSTLNIIYTLSFDSAALTNDEVSGYVSETSANVQSNIYLPVVGITSGSSIVWQSSNPDVIGTNGKVTRPAFESGDANVTLTATVSNNGVSDTKTFDLTVIKKDHVTTYVSIGFNNNGGTTEANPELVTIESGKSVESLPTAPTKTGYTFLGWNTMANGSGTAFLADTLVTANITVYAKWQITNPDNSNNDDKEKNDPPSTPSSPSAPATPSTPASPTTPSTPASPTTPASPATPSTPASPATEKSNPLSITETLTSEAKVDSNGKATASVTEAQMSESVKKAIDSAAKLGNGTKAQVEVKLTATPDAKVIETSMPKTTFDNIVNSEINTLKISSSIANLTFDSQALKTMSQNGVGDVNVTISKVDTSTLNETTKKTIGDRPVFDFTVTNDGKKVSQFGGNVTVEVPYTPLAGESADALVVYYVNDNGELEMITSGRYNAETGTIRFTTNHFSQYVVGYNKIEYTDVSPEAWYSKAIHFVSARGIASGTGNDQFSPNNKLTRGQLLVMIMKAYDLKAEENSKDNFSDAGNTYYTGYLAAAKKLGITSGVGHNNYAPEKEINRQEMFTMLYNTLKVLDKLPQVTTETGLKNMSDQAQVAPWAKEAMTLFVNADIASGSAGKVLPKDSTSRAQMAQVLYNLMTK